VRGAADLHLHSSESDGRSTPGALVDAAADAGLRYMALCDHDSVGGVERALRRARSRDVCVIPGVELGVHVTLPRAGGDPTDSRLAAGEVHLLGYGMRDMVELEDLLEDMRRSREHRIYAILENLAGEGIDLKEEDVRRQLGASSVPGRPHVARALVARGCCRTEAEAFSRWLVPGRPGYIPRKKLSLERGIAAVRRAGGVPVFAHPGQMYSLLEDAVRLGVRGVEVVHPDHSCAVMSRLLRFAREHDLLPTGGSDFHGRPSDPAVGEVTAPAAWAEALLAEI